MLTLAFVGRAVTDWCRAPSALRSYRARFSRPFVIPDDDEGASLTVTGLVTSVDGNRNVSIAIEAVAGQELPLLTQAEAVVAWPAGC
jgi:acyl dehydratase